MALITYEDLQPALNIDLTDSAGQEFATAAIAAVRTYMSGPASLVLPMEEAQVTEYITSEFQRYLLQTTAPVLDITAATRDTTTNTCDTIDAANIVHHGGREL